MLAMAETAHPGARKAIPLKIHPHKSVEDHLLHLMIDAQLCFRFIGYLVETLPMKCQAAEWVQPGVRLIASGPCSSSCVGDILAVKERLSTKVESIADEKILFRPRYAHCPMTPRGPPPPKQCYILRD